MRDLAYPLPQCRARLNVNAERRLIQRNDVRVRQQGACQREPSLHSARVHTHTVMLARCQTNQVKHFGDACGAVVLGDIVQARVKEEILLGGQVVVEGGFLRHNAQYRPHPRHICGHVHPLDKHRTRSRFQQPAEQIDGSRLA